ncbi:coiled coil helix coiled coil helix [Echinococcus multilocularis]|uniref:Coiled coil helix coiled coil helix n=1 Tax=Echinococcus multilocularis TaxID=6211 RepID=A0A087W028_ECHMU|nr:coiled coil helix coiled coil helix [Echinococcus multilocularis]
MRISDSLCKLYKRSSHRRHDLEFFKYKYYRDPILKNKVSGKGEKEPRAVCVEEMALMLACLKSNDFEEKPCSQVIDAFNKCVAAAELRRERNKQARQLGHFNNTSDDPDEVKRLSSIQINRVLRKFPEP